MLVGTCFHNKNILWNVKLLIHIKTRRKNWNMRLYLLMKRTWKTSVLFGCCCLSHSLCHILHSSYNSLHAWVFEMRVHRKILELEFQFLTIKYFIKPNKKNVFILFSLKIKSSKNEFLCCWLPYLMLSTATKSKINGWNLTTFSILYYLYFSAPPVQY